MVQKKHLGLDGFIWWIGVVESRKDPLKLGRLQVRISGWHEEDKTNIPTENLPWAMPSISLDHGKNTIGPRERDVVWGFFLDGEEAEQPVVVGMIPGYPEDESDPEVGFNDPTPDEELNTVPRPPEYLDPETLKDTDKFEKVENEDGTVSYFAKSSPETEGEEEKKVSGRFTDTSKVPFTSTGMGMLQDEFSESAFPYDLDKDGDFDQDDVDTIVNNFVNNGFVDAYGAPFSQVFLPKGRYPLAGELKAPTTHPLAVGVDDPANKEANIVAQKKAAVSSFNGATYVGTGLPGDEPVNTSPFVEPETPYAAVYPYNHVYYSESGHAIEIDDTPGAERLHLYHRSGTFTEYHPDGTLVEKCLADKYEISMGNHFIGTSKKFSVEATESVRLKAGTEAVLEALGPVALQGSAISQKAGKWFVGCEEATISAGTTVIAGDVVIGGSLTVSGTSTIVGKQDVVGVLNVAGALQSPFPISPEEPEIDEEALAELLLKAEQAEEGSSGIQPGFILDGAKQGYLWKPVSESDGKVVTLAPVTGAPHEIYEAIPTTEFENVDIQYIHEDGSTTTWSVTRPVHVKGKLIQSIGNLRAFIGDGRDLANHPLKASEYPRQVIWSVGDTEWLILDTRIRHD